MVRRSWKKIALRSHAVFLQAGLGPPVRRGNQRVRPVVLQPLNLQGKDSAGTPVLDGLILHYSVVKHSRPVPRFLFLDQPSQVFSPAEWDVEGSTEALNDEDRLAVVWMFELTRDVVAQLWPGLQIIVTEHAEIQGDCHQDAVAELWLKGAALMQAAWSSGADANAGDGGE